MMCKKERRYNLRKGPGSPVIDVTVKKDSLSVYVLNFFRNFGGSVRWSSGKGERVRNERCGLILGCGFLSF